METDSSCKPLRNLSFAAALCSVVWLKGTFGRTIEMINNPPAVSEGHEVALYIVAAAYAALSLVLVCALGVFLYHQIRSLKNGIVFSKVCENTLFAWAALWPVYDVCGTQLENLQRGYHIQTIEGSAIGVTLIVFTLAVLYKTARQITEKHLPH